MSTDNDKTITGEERVPLIRVRGKIKGKLTSSEKILASINDNTDFDTLGLEDRLEKHLKLWDDFTDVQNRIENIVSDETELEDLDLEQEQFENRFHSITGLFKKYIKKSNPLTYTHSVTSDAIPTLSTGQGNVLNSNNVTEMNAVNYTARFELPKLQAPTFHGNLDTWLSFHDSFRSMCHDNPCISDIQKFHYLKACLKDEAAEVIASLEITNNNYQIAWELLNSRYDNRKYITESHVQALLDLPCISKEFSVRTLLDNVQKRIRALQALNQPIQHWDVFLILIIRQKFTSNLREKWEESVGSTELPTYKKLVSFLERRALIEDAQGSQKVKENFKPHGKSQNYHSRNKNSSTCLTTTTDNAQNKNSNPCPACKESHLLENCEKFKQLIPQDRYDLVKKASICHNCFKSNHRTVDCKKYRCKKCHRRHHILLHFESNQSSEIDSTAKDLTCQVVNMLVNRKSTPQNQIILGTAIVDILDSNGRYRTCRAFLDSCSQCNSITEKFANSLGLRKKEVNMNLKGIENLHSKIKYVTATEIKSRYEGLKLNLSFFIFKDISDCQPALPIDKASLQIPENIFLADPDFNHPGEIDILIGAEHFYNLLRAGQIKVRGQTALFQETDLGWIFAGRYVHPQNSKLHFNENSSISCNLIKFHNLPILWELDNENDSKHYSAEELAAEKHYSKHVCREDSGKYLVKLPFNEKKDLLGNSKNTAYQRFYSLEKRFLKDPDLKTRYVECLNTYFQEGHISRLSDIDSLRPGYFLPHQAVVKSDSLTTKTRVVFDGSAKTSSGISLNDTLLVGPTIQEDLFSIVVRFRSFMVAFTADIKQMYRQVRVDPDDIVFQKILWRENPNDPIKTYALNTVTFGTSCAPFLAIRTLHQLADDEGKSFPMAAKVIKEDVYVDDFMSGSRTLHEARQLRDDLITILRRGGFVLRKWSSNCPELCSEISSESSDEFLSLDPSEIVKSLGIHWNPVNDSILYTVNIIDSSDQMTKRSILSECSKLFDPLGLVGPVILVGKILIQSLWKLQLGWDDVVPLEINEQWSNYKEQLPLLSKIKFPRCLLTENHKVIQLHGFSDASEKAYGACLYLRTTNEKNEHNCVLICSKSRVAPIKNQTLPRLELCAAVLLVQLFKVTARSLQLTFENTFFWTDSTIVLNWINSSPHTLPTFVANRVAEIQRKTESKDWKHIRTKDNPADFISRGQNPEKFISNQLWLQGPEWLQKNETFWPQFDFKSCEKPEFSSSNPQVNLTTTQSEFHVWNRYSSFKKLQVIIAYCRRFISNSRTAEVNSRLSGRLSTKELNQSRISIIKNIQAISFSKELKALENKEQVDKTSQLLNLNPFIDEGILKVGGRLIRSSLPESQKFPIVLPKNHAITRTIIRDEHIKRCHAGVNATLYGVRESYWPLDGRNTVRHVLRKCVSCFRTKPRDLDYIMGNLPESRVTFTRPFLNVGVDYCGPFFTKEHRHRNRTKLKTYVSIFVCLATKAVHLELASDLTTEAFLASLKRFFARRGLASSMHSDNGKNFIGASREIKELFQKIKGIENDEKIQSYLLKNEVKWHFIPPRAPHFGGLWEAGVKSFKTHFIRVAGNNLLTYEQLHTYVVEIEAILNSRPLTPLSSDPNDFLPLTPGHFLTGNSLTSLPQEDLTAIPPNRLNCWQLAQRMRHHFWERWYKEYLNELTTRNKWKIDTDQADVAIGRLVIVKEENLPPMTWKLARIINIHPGEDGVIRTVTIKTASSTFKRPIKKLCLLPIE